MKKLLFFSILPILVIAGCRNNYYSMADFGKVSKIDSHIHLNSDRNAFPEQAKKDNFRLLTLNVDAADSETVKKQLGYSLLLKQQYPGTVFYGATFYFDTTGWDTYLWSRKAISHLEHNISGGAVTVKVWKNIGMTERDRKGKFIMIDDPRIGPVLDYIEGRGLPLTGHLGEPRNCWLPLNEMTVSSDSSYFAQHPQYHMFLHKDYPSYEDQIDARDRMLDKHPHLTFIGCHLGSLEWNVDELAKRLDKYPNMAVDMAARICHLQFQSAKDRDRVRNFCIKYQDRLLYGTDIGDGGSGTPVSFAKHTHKVWLDDWKYFVTDDEMTSDKFRGNFTGLKLPREVVDKIYYGNAVKWYKLKL